MVSSNVRPVKTRIVSCFSLAVSVPHDGMSLETGTFSGSQKLPVRRSQTSASFSSCKRFQLIAETRSTNLSLSLTRAPLRVCYLGFRHYPWGATTPGSTTSCVAVSEPFGPQSRYSLGLRSCVASQYCQVIPLHRARLTPCSSRYQLRQPPVFHTEPASFS